MFDRYAAATSPSWGRRALIMASVLVHVTAALVLLVWSIFHIAEIPAPEIALHFFSAPPPPPPPAPGGEREQRTKRPKVEQHSTLVEPTQPTVVKQAQEPSASTDDGPT